MGLLGMASPTFRSPSGARKADRRLPPRRRKPAVVLTPVALFAGAIAKTFWGKAWCDNLERYSDYANRLPRGRTYVRNGSVIDLQITPGEVRAQVIGSSLYQVDRQRRRRCPTRNGRRICADCAGSIDSLVELLQGKLSNAVMERICQPGTGLFPSPKEITFDCSCPDWATMCKHVAAVLYGVGARLDQQPEAALHAAPCRCQGSGQPGKPGAARRLEAPGHRQGARRRPAGRCVRSRDGRRFCASKAGGKKDKRCIPENTRSSENASRQKIGIRQGGGQIPCQTTPISQQQSCGTCYKKGGKPTGNAKTQESRHEQRPRSAR